MGVADSAEVDLAEEEAVEEVEGDPELTEELDEVERNRVEDEDNEDVDTGVWLAVDVTELNDVAETAFLDLDEVVDGEVDETLGLELLDESLEDMPEMDELPRLELDDEAAVRVFEVDELALLPVSMPVTHLVCPRIHTCL